MSHKDVYACLSPVVECCHMAYPKGEAPPLPWAIFYKESGTGVYTDNKRHTKKNSWVVELYMKTHDEKLEDAVADAIENNPRFSSYNTYESWVNDENCLMVVFRFAEIERSL